MTRSIKTAPVRFKAPPGTVSKLGWVIFFSFSYFAKYYATKNYHIFQLLRYNRKQKLLRRGVSCVML